MGHQRRKFSAPFQRIGNGFALADVLPGTLDRFFKHTIIHDPFGDIECIEELDAARQHGRQRTGQP